jgi:putative effector of murein hydrolase
VALLVFLLWITRTPYATYFEGAQFVHFLLGPATVALAVPLYANLGTLRRNLVPLAAVISALGIGWMLGASRESLLSLAPKTGLNGLLTAFLFPLLVRLWGG